MVFLIVPCAVFGGGVINLVSELDFRTGYGDYGGRVDENVISKCDKHKKKGE